MVVAIKMCRWLLSFSIFALLGQAGAAEFSQPRDFSEFESNLGEQQLVDVVHPWVGLTPQEIAPGSIPLGSLKRKIYVPAQKIKDEPEPFLPEKRKIEPIALPDEQNFPVEITGDPLPVESTAPGWVGPLPQELAPNSKRLGSLANRKVITRSKSVDPVQPVQTFGGGDMLPPVESNEEDLLQMNIFFSSRPYYSYNVLRLRNGDDEAGVWENMAGASLSTREFTLGSYLTLVPRLDLLMLVASYEDKEVQTQNLKKLLSYRFGLVKGGVDIGFPRDFTLSLAYEYDLLNNLDSGDKMFDAFVPSVRLSKIFELGETALLMVDGSARYSSTDRELPNPLPGQFPDDGDNLQVGFNLSLIKLLGSSGQFMVMPTLGVSRTEYLNHDNDGRVDWSTHLGLSGSWQATDWLSLELGLSYTIMRMNDVGRFLQGDASRYEAFDLGLTLMAFHAF
jgi:hypothetical protein